MRLRKTGIVLAAAVTLATIGAAHSRFPSPDSRSSPGVTLHEWGTFTSVAGVDGRAIDWLALSGHNDLPCFVKHLNGNIVSKGEIQIGAAIGQQVTYEQALTRLVGKVRMETPVIYFYSPS